MVEMPDLTPEYFEILTVRELRKVGLEVSQLRVQGRATLPEPERGYLLELKGVVSRARWRRHVLIGCRRQNRVVGRADVESFKAHFREFGADAGILFATAPFEPDALAAAQDGTVALLRVTDGRIAFDTSGWGTPGHYPAWLPAYCAQVVGRDISGQLCYQLLESGQGDVIVNQLRAPSDAPSRGHTEETKG